MLRLRFIALIRLLLNTMNTADCQDDWNEAYVIKLMDEKLKDIRIKMKSIILNRNVKKCFKSCLVKIEQSRGRRIEI